MSIRILVDMNLSPQWVPVFQNNGWHAIHWSSVGDWRAPDPTIMQWALANGYVVFTHDLDFGTLLALTHARGPSVIQVRAEDVLPDHLSRIVLAALKQHETDLAHGSLIVVNERTCRVRVLPI